MLPRRFVKPMICRKVCLVALLGVGSVLVRAADPVPVVPAEAPAPGQFDSLITNSPFGMAAAPGVQPGSDGSGLEFRGVFVDKGEPYFSVHDSANRSSQWVGLKESGQPYVVESYDLDKGSIQVKYRNQVMNLALKRSQVVVQAMPMPAPAGGPQFTPGVPAIAANPASQDEATRMAQVAEEIRRRRALRAPPGQGPQPNAVNIRPGAMIQPNAPNNPARPFVPPARP